MEARGTNRSSSMAICYDCCLGSLCKSAMLATSIILKE